MKVSSLGRVLITGLALLLSVAGICTVAQADSREERRSVTLRVTDKDLASEEGMNVVYRRLKFAARVVCSDLGPSRLLSHKIRFDKCVNHAIEMGAAQLDHVGFQEYAAVRLRKPQEPLTASR